MATFVDSQAVISAITLANSYTNAFVCFLCLISCAGVHNLCTPAVWFWRGHMKTEDKDFTIFSHIKKGVEACK